MYGMVNKAIEDMVCAEHGEEVWERVKSAAGVDIEVFVSNEGYPDAITYSLVGAASRVLAVSPENVLQAFGVHWVLKTAREGYGDLLEAGGRSLGEFLLNLPNFHARVELLLPNLEPPRFMCHEAGPGMVRVTYHSRREGLAHFVVGLLHGLGRMFDTPITVRHDVVRGASADHDEFLVSWEGATAG